MMKTQSLVMTLVILYLSVLSFHGPGRAMGQDSGRRGTTTRDTTFLPEDALQYSGIYPHLAVFNQQSECGIGAVVPWADRLWLVTYMPHGPGGSDDKLYEITPDLQQIIRPESIGGTPANRMIHRESQQLFMGPYAIDRQRRVRAIPYDHMYGRPTGNARHLFDPEHKIYYATMEEGFYEVDVNSLAVKELYRDGNRTSNMGGTLLPGYHGKGLYSGQGRLIYANNGENSSEARQRPDVPSGVLATWDGHDWTVVQRNQFTEVTGPGGLTGNANPAVDPVWSIGWDYRSLILMLLDQGQWHRFRLPKASHCYDGAHGWNTEWPRIRDIGEGDDWLMTMHGEFWHFPKSFAWGRTAGIRPRSTYLKVVGDFCRWGDRLVLGCDDTAKSAFLNKRRAKGHIAAPGISHSNLWFIPPSSLDELGTPLGRGAVWIEDSVAQNSPSDPYLFEGFDRRSVFIAHGSGEPVTFRFEIDTRGDGQWQPLTQFTVAPGAMTWHAFDPTDQGVWIRVSTDRDCRQATVQFHYTNVDTRTTRPDPMFAGLAKPASRHLSGGLMHVRGDNLRTLGFAATQIVDGKPSEPQWYELDGQMKLTPLDDPGALQWTLDKMSIPQDILTVDAGSVVYVDDEGHRWRLPKGDPALDTPGLLGPERVDREVVTERDLFHCHGTFYELPARNAGGFSKIRPICSHRQRIKDYCSYRGLLILSGVDSDDRSDNPHLIHSTDGRVALWAGVVDDLWKLGKPVGVGGPWKETSVKADVPSDPYLMTGYDTKRLTLSTQTPGPVTIHVEVDITGTGHWQRYKSFPVSAKRPIRTEFPEAFQAYWVRLVSNRDAQVTGQFEYD